MANQIPNILAADPNDAGAPVTHKDRRRSYIWRKIFTIRKELSNNVGGALSLAFFVAFVAGWWGLASSGLVNPLFLPTPLEVYHVAIRSYTVDKLWLDLGISVYRVLVGFGIAVIVAVPLGILMGSFQFFRSLLEPFLAFLRYMPATAFIPLLVLWLGIDDGQKFSVIWLGTFFHLTLLVMTSTLTVPLPLIEAAMMLGATQRQIVTKVIWRSAKPLIFENLRIVLGWAWTYIVVAEIVAADSGVGYQILKASRFLDTPMIFVGILSIGLVGVLSDFGFNALGRKLFPYVQRNRV